MGSRHSNSSGKQQSSIDTAVLGSLHLNSVDLEALRIIFDHISSSSDDDGLIDEKEFNAAISGTSVSKAPPPNFLFQRLFRVFDTSPQDDHLTFEEFARCVSALSERSSLDEKCRVSFQCFDVNNDGMIDLSELTNLLQACLVQQQTKAEDCGLKLSNQQIQRICNYTLQQVDTNHDGVISYDEYQQLVHDYPRLIDPLTIQLEAIRERAREITLKSRGDAEIQDIDPPIGKKRRNSRFGCR
jgi:Ca2+-binding EF-hand superfamily protein